MEYLDKKRDFLDFVSSILGFSKKRPNLATCIEIYSDLFSSIQNHSESFGDNPGLIDH